MREVKIIETKYIMWHTLMRTCSLKIYITRFMSALIIKEVLIVCSDSQHVTCCL